MDLTDNVQKAKEIHDGLYGGGSPKVLYFCVPEKRDSLLAKVLQWDWKKSEPDF